MNKVIMTIFATLMAIVGGLLFSQLVTLYLTTVFFTYLEGLPEHAARVRLALRRALHFQRDAGELRSPEAPLAAEVNGPSLQGSRSR